jgi:hypothetical protein
LRLVSMMSAPSPFRRIAAHVPLGSPPVAFGADDSIVVIAFPHRGARRVAKVVDAFDRGEFEPGDERPTDFCAGPVRWGFPVCPSFSDSPPSPAVPPSVDPSVVAVSMFAPSEPDEPSISPVADLFRLPPFLRHNPTKGIHVHSSAFNRPEEAQAILRTLFQALPRFAQGADRHEIRRGLGVIPPVGATRRVVRRVFFVSRAHDLAGIDATTGRAGRRGVISAPQTRCR